ncbi:MAG: hypothetical protein ABI472_17515 [Ginsengibacter sp.]
MDAAIVPLKAKYLTIMRSYLIHKKYECLLISFLLLIFGNTFGTSPGRFIIGVVDIYQNFIVGFLVFYNKKWLRNFIFCIILTTVLLDVFTSQLYFLNLRNWHSTLYLVFFFVVANAVFKEVLYAKTVSRELLAAAVLLKLLILSGESVNPFNLWFRLISSSSPLQTSRSSAYHTAQSQNLRFT